MSAQTTSQALQTDPLQLGPHLLLDLLPHGMNRAMGLPSADSPVDDAPVDRDRPVHRLHDIEKGDVLCRAGQLKAAPGSPVGTDKADLDEVLENLRQQRLRNVHAPGDVAEQRHLVRRPAGQVYHAPDGVIPFSRDMKHDAPT